MPGRHRRDGNARRFDGHDFIDAGVFVQFIKRPYGRAVRDSDSFTRSSELQPANVLVPRLVTLLGISISVSDMQPAKASLPMLVSPSEKFMLFNLSQFSKAASYMVIISSGTVTAVSSPQYLIS